MGIKERERRVEVFFYGLFMDEDSCVGRVLNRKAVRSPPSTASPSSSANWSLHRRGVLLQQIDELAHVVHLREIFRHRGAPLAVHAARGQPGNKRPHYVAEGSWDLVGKETGPHKGRIGPHTD